MKLYHARGTCSLAALIVAREAGIPIEIEKVDLRASPHRTQDGSDFSAINPKGYVPALRLDDGELLTEGVAILQYLADLEPKAGLAPLAGTFERHRLQEWLTFISSELHKTFSPWLFHPEYGEQAAAVARARIAHRFEFLDRHLGDRDHLLDRGFTVADAYCFTIVRWAPSKGVDLHRFRNLAGYLTRIEGRPNVQEALRADEF